MDELWKKKSLEKSYREKTRGVRNGLKRPSIQKSISESILRNLDTTLFWKLVGSTEQKFLLKKDLKIIQAIRSHNNDVISYRFWIDDSSEKTIKIAITAGGLTSLPEDAENNLDRYIVFIVSVENGLLEFVDKDFMLQGSELTEMRTKQMNVAGSDIDAVLMAGGPGYKIYFADNIDSYVLMLGKKQVELKQGSEEHAITAQLVSAPYLSPEKRDAALKSFQDMIKTLKESQYLDLPESKKEEAYRVSESMDAWGVPLVEAEYKGKEVDLNKPFRTPGGPKKFSVYVMNPQTKNVNKVNFGDPEMEIKRDDKDARKNFRARHGCDDAKDKTTAKYWSCKFWSEKSVSDLLKGESEEIFFLE